MDKPSDIYVWLRCPNCRLVWQAATIRPGSWWAKGITPETAASQCYCPRCEHKPPMETVTKESWMV